MSMVVVIGMKSRKIFEDILLSLQLQLSSDTHTTEYTYTYIPLEQVMSNASSQSKGKGRSADNSQLASQSEQHSRRGTANPRQGQG